LKNHFKYIRFLEKLIESGALAPSEDEAKASFSRFYKKFIR